MLTYNYPSGKILCKIYSTIQNVFEINIFTEQNMFNQKQSKTVLL